MLVRTARNAWPQLVRSTAQAAQQTNFDEREGAGGRECGNDSGPSPDAPTNPGRAAWLVTGSLGGHFFARRPKSPSYWSSSEV